ncbi:MAG: hypothetical protein ACKPKO_44440, partial [Candidatus Fonsibacter sp.]
MIEDGRMRIAENEANANVNIISVIQTVEKLHKRPSVCINYLRVSASVNGMTLDHVAASGRGRGVAAPEDEERGQVQFHIVNMDLSPLCESIMSASPEDQNKMGFVGPSPMNTH